jgi:hypothetical protein
MEAKCQVKISNIFALLEDLDDNGNTNVAWQNQQSEMSSKEILVNTN